MSESKTLATPVPPGGRIGILGGGQLGRMLALAAARLGLRVHVHSDETDAPAFQVASRGTLGANDDRAGLHEFAKSCDVVTYEFENIAPSMVETVQEVVAVHPGLKALTVAQDRLVEKQFIGSLGIKTAPFVPLSQIEDAGKLRSLGAAGILKTRRMGYDGKGQAKVTSGEEAAAAFRRFHSASCIIEGVIDFSFEASVVAARGMDGSFAAYDPPENLHEHHILRRSTVPGRLTAAQAQEAKAIAKKIADALGYVGVLAVELFVLKDGSLLVNEIAPRVHNSGHWTLEACAVSQFEQHIRAVAGWPLGDPARHSDAVMENIIGAEAAEWRSYAARPGALHLYGKAEARPGRKMGHFTTLSPLTKR